MTDDDGPERGHYPRRHPSEVYGRCGVFPIDTDALIASAVERADEAFVSTDGSLLQWVRECFLPELEARGLAVISRTDGDAEALLVLALGALREREERR